MEVFRPELPVFDSIEAHRLHIKQRLAAAFRLFSKFGFDERVAGHITARDPEHKDCFWVNPYATHFSQNKVSNLSLVHHEGRTLHGTPRDESYREDVLTAQAMPQREPSDLWRNLRAGAETGWDYSSRWFADNRTLATIDVTSLVPVDLNCLMAGLERTLAKAYGLEGDARDAARMNRRAQRKPALPGSKTSMRTQALPLA